MISQNQFTENLVQELPRTRFKCPHSHKTTGNTGEFIPIYAKEILPHDTISMNLRSLVKMTTPAFQTMDNLFMDVAFFFIPRRLVWEHWKEFQGEKHGIPRQEQPEYTIPTTSAPEGGWAKGTIADHLEIPTYKENIKPVDSAYFRAYCLVWNEWYRDQFRQQETDFTIDDVNVVGSNGNNYITDAILGGKPLKVAKLHDYFTSTLLSAQDGNPVQLPLGSTAAVIGNGLTLGLTNGTTTGGLIGNTSDSGTLYAKADIQGNPPAGSPIGIGGDAMGGVLGVTSDPTYSGLIADLSTATAATIAQLRMAFALQRIFENNNRSGTRYTEILANRWGVTPPDASLQRPEYLGGKRIPITMDMVVQTSSTDETSPLGQISGFVNQWDEDEMFTKSFEEHGILMGFAYVRHQRTYQQGLHRKFTRQDMEDFYMPEFAHLGEQPVYNYQIYSSGTSADDEVFGYQEYGAEYRFEQNAVTGQFRSNSPNSFDNWHYADDYADTPVNNADWIVENPDAVDRTLTLPSSTNDQFYFDFYFDETDVRSIPAHSIPVQMNM